MRTIRIFLFLCVSMGLLGIGLYFLFPSYIYDLNQRWSFYKSGFLVKRISVDDMLYEYAEKGKGEVVLFLHGFQGCKNYWLPFAQHLQGYRVIIPDLPGHGHSTYFKEQHFDLKSLAQSIDSFVNSKKIEKFHLVGTSMGGGVATFYASLFPQKLLSLSLFNPLAIRPPKKSDVEKSLDKGKNPLFPTNLGDVDELFSILYGKRLDMSVHFKKLILERLDKKRQFYQHFFDEMISSEPVEDLLPQIEVRTLLLIGASDRVVHPSVFHIYAKGFPNVKPYLITDGAHVFVDGCFDRAVVELKQFLGEN